MKDLFKKARYISVPQAKRAISELQEDTQLDDIMICVKCEKKISIDKYESLHKVCPSCGHHTRLNSFERLVCTADKNSFEEKYNNLITANPLDFGGYLERVEKLKLSTGLDEAVKTGYAKINGISCALGIMDSTFLMASMGSVVGEKLSRLFEGAIEDRLPVIIFTASGGARMQEGIVSLMQMAKVSAAVGRHSAAGLLYITVLCDPTAGGVTASFASLGDIIVAEPGAMVGFAGRRVITGTIGHKLPDNFQTSEFFMQRGYIDMIIPRYKMRDTLTQLLKLNAKREGGYE